MVTDLAIHRRRLPRHRPSFDNPDFVDVVVHSYRHRFGLVEGDPAYEETEQAIATQPAIPVPTVVLDPEHDGLGPPDSLADHERHFTDIVERRLVDSGHNPPQERPDEFAAAVLRLVSGHHAAE